MKKFTKARRRKFSEQGPKTRTELRVELRREYILPQQPVRPQIVQGAQK